MPRVGALQNRGHPVEPRLPRVGHAMYAPATSFSLNVSIAWTNRSVQEAQVYLDRVVGRGRTHDGRIDQAHHGRRGGQELHRRQLLDVNESALVQGRRQEGERRGGNESEVGVEQKCRGRGVGLSETVNPWVGGEGRGRGRGPGEGGSEHRRSLPVLFDADACVCRAACEERRPFFADALCCLLR